MCNQSLAFIHPPLVKWSLAFILDWIDTCQLRIISYQNDSSTWKLFGSNFKKKVHTMKWVFQWGLTWQSEENTVFTFTLKIECFGQNEYWFILPLFSIYPRCTVTPAPLPHSSVWKFLFSPGPVTDYYIFRFFGKFPQTFLSKKIGEFWRGKSPETLWKSPTKINF